MTFQQYVENKDKEDDWISQQQFSDYLFKKKYPTLEKDFRDFLFFWDEKQDILSVYMGVADEEDVIDP